MSRRPVLGAVAVLVAVLFGGLGVALHAKMAAADDQRVVVSSVGAVPPAPMLLVMGDSVAAGSDYGGQGCTGFPMITARSVGWRWGCTAVGGTGYLGTFLAGTKPYESGQAAAAIAARPDLIVVEGSTNDVGAFTPAEVTAAAVALYSHLQAALPGVRIVAVGPVTADPAKVAALQPHQDAVRQAAVATGAAFIDPNAQGWLTRAPRSMIGPDGLHPTAEGHVRIAQLLGADLARLGLLPAASS